MKGPSVFLDTVGLLALWDRSDQWHVPATQAFQTFFQERISPVVREVVKLRLSASGG